MVTEPKSTCGGRSITSSQVWGRDGTGANFRSSLAETLGCLEPTTVNARGIANSKIAAGAVYRRQIPIIKMLSILEGWAYCSVRHDLL